MQKYVYYLWEMEDCGGDGICLAEKYTPVYSSAEGTFKQRKLGEFDTIDELVDLMVKHKVQTHYSVSEAREAAEAFMNGTGPLADCIVNI